ncbi:dual specificity protein phosphatase family protein [Lutimaribacter sp. EGI FJ00015]|uniref:Dual specificity protein phosphatase family protein n=1 Tax=Lutimaribacter degradans TaxID=2945989 RepID=A0ACC5ZWW1_9RHOB|nr:dual specificity protein phosphatase family protein [Lutimaribacter sp. EGI FJ00013]MCM2562807.1 dual specificity protein phosphatase family protein [Lutimaribacter sp. EGI FJ00013]MCO0613964.1 dual specificity protein phosphatase family protein [Lutimaribacter sp. EGI FJ00015]MCO0636936.1 dual specificity protein phosphatase family protein [Lutimaribacter sp. EGI FJ00014]
MVIHALPVAGGILAICPMPGLDGDHAADIEHMREWQPALVLTLVTKTELVNLGAEGLGQKMQDSGSRWFHIPIEDMGIPDKQTADRWPEVSRLALSALRGGGRVLVHCHGGCGRSGMIALRLMCEAGEDPAAALERLRHVRPCAVETEAQMEWAVRVRPPEFVHRHNA